MRKASILMAVLLVAACAHAGQPARPAPFVTVGKVVELDNVETKRYTGHVTHVASVNLVARVSGELLHMGFREGDTVKKGQVLYELDPVRYEAAVQSAEANIAQNEARLNYAQLSYDRSRNLWEQRAASKDAMDSSESEQAAYRAALSAAEAALITAKDDLKNTLIVAPITGKIGVSAYTEGNYITPNSGVMATIMQVDPLRVNFAMANRDYLSMFGTEANLKENAVIRLRLADDSMYEHDGRVEFIDNQANQRTDSIQVYATFANPDGRLMPGSTVTVLFARRTGGKLAAVIPSAVMHDSKEAYVYVLDADNKVERRAVELGSATERAQLIRSGLAAGERIVVDGMHKAMPGMAVEPDYADASYDVAVSDHGDDFPAAAK